MKAILRRPDIDLNSHIVMREVLEENLVVADEAVMSIDGSTTNTGVAILRKSDGALIFSLSFSREKDKNETPVQYKVRLKKFVHNILSRNRAISIVYYEEPFIGYAEAAKNLLMLRTFIEELVVEYEPHYDYLKHFEVNNMKWKKKFLAPDKCPTGTELQKAAVRKKLESFMPYLSVVTQDEIDAICLGFVAATQIKDGEEEELESKKIRPFQYNIEFIGANEDDDMITEFADTFRGPQKVAANGVVLTEINGTVNFDKHVYKTMGNEDKILIIKFSSNHHGNLILKYKLGYLSTQFEYLYAIVWRKTRK